MNWSDEIGPPVEPNWTKLDDPCHVGAEVQQRHQRLELIRARRLVQRGVSALVLAVHLGFPLFHEKLTRRRVTPVVEQREGSVGSGVRRGRGRSGGAGREGKRSA